MAEVYVNTFQQDIIIDSDPASGSSFLSADGSTFTVDLLVPIEIPRFEDGVLSCTISCQECRFWNTFANLKTGINDSFLINITAVPFLIVLQEGLYSLSNLLAALKRELEILGGDSSVFNFTPDDATQTVYIEVFGTVADPVFIDFGIVNNMGDLLGFTAGQTVPLIPPATTTVSQQGNVEADFNKIQQVLIHSDLCDTGLRINNRFDSIMMEAPIDQPPGFEVVNRPFHPPIVSANKLVGNETSRFRNWISDVNGNLLNTSGEFWGCRFVIEWKIQQLLTDQAMIDEKKEIKGYWRNIAENTQKLADILGEMFKQSKNQKEQPL